jgi:hypothetical protein
MATIQAFSSYRRGQRFSYVGILAGKIHFLRHEIMAALLCLILGLPRIPGRLCRWGFAFAYTQIGITTLQTSKYRVNSRRKVGYSNGVFILRTPVIIRVL